LYIFFANHYAALNTLSFCQDYPKFNEFLFTLYVLYTCMYIKINIKFIIFFANYLSRRLEYSFRLLAANNKPSKRRGQHSN